MPYYDTIEEDIDRAKEILAKGRITPADLPEGLPDDIVKRMVGMSGGIVGVDNYAAFKLLESFVEHIEEMHKDQRLMIERIKSLTDAIGDLYLGHENPPPR